jgi:hypothetical protein
MLGRHRSGRLDDVFRCRSCSVGVKNLGPFGDSAVLSAKDKPAFLVLKPGNGAAPSGNGVTLGFAAAGPRGHLPGAYAGYLRDPVGNKVRAHTFV